MSAAAIGPVRVGADAPMLVIAGPCAAESEQLCLDVAGRLQEACRRAQVGYVFKASFDKANRSGAGSGRGPGRDAGLAALARVRTELEVPVLTDIHQPADAAAAAQVCDALQIPAFLCRQTDLLAAAAATGRAVHIKKGQFLAPEDMAAIVAKARAAGAADILVCERGTSFGYHNLIVDMRALVVMRAAGCPVIFDATHSAQLPTAGAGESSGQRRMALPLARAAIAAGIDGLFLEAHPEPLRAVSDSAVQLPLAAAADLIAAAADLHRCVRKLPAGGRPEEGDGLP